MTASEYKRAGELFDQLRELPESERTAALDKACPDSAEVRAQVVRLLEADREAGNGSFLGRPALADAAKLMARTPAHLPTPGTVIGNYRLGGRIAAGGMGVVCEAEDLHLNRRVAVKILPPSFAGEGEERIQRFQREARAASALNHPHIVSIYDAGFDKGCYYIAMEYVEGTTLRDRLSSGWRPDIETILEVVGQTASALSAAHQAGIVHRDIKPENIVLRPDGFVKVLDFGLARVTETAARVGDEGELLTRPGHLAGTIQYVAPEQVLGKAADARSDVFSLGVVAYELATGARPFDGPTDGAIFDAILNANPSTPSSIHPAIAPLDGMILQALEKDPELRFQTASDLRSCCRRLSRDSMQSVPLPLAPVAKAGNRRHLVPILVGIPALVLIAGLAWLYFSMRGGGAGKDSNPPPLNLLTALPGYQLDPSLSPDGKKLAFVWNGNGDNYDIYVKRTDDDQMPRRLTSNPAEDVQPSWSPDGSQIAFLRFSPAKKEIFVIPSEGGPEQKIAEIEPLDAPWTEEASTMRHRIGPAWSPDGKTLAVTDRCSATGTSDCVYLLAVDGSSRRRLTSGAPVGDYGPGFSPDGRQIAFLRTTADVGYADIYTESVNGGSPRRLTTDNKVISSLAWSANHRIYFVSNRNGDMLPWSIADNGGDLRIVAGLGGQALAVSAASHADAIAGARFYRNTNIWRTNLLAPGHPSELLIGSSRVNHSPQYSPDGSQIVFFSNRSGSQELWVAGADGSNPHRVTMSSSRRPIGSPNWSPDGKQFVFDALISPLSQIYLMNVDGTNQRQFTNDPWEAMMPTWSADGRFVYYVVRRNGALSLWKKPVEGGSPIHIVDGVFSEGLESADGKWVYFSMSQPGIWQAPSSGGEPRLIPELANVVDSRHLFVNAKGIYFLAHELPPWQIRFFDFATRRVTPVATIARTPEFFTRSLSISPDGKWMLHTQVDQTGSEIVMLSGE